MYPISTFPSKHNIPAAQFLHLQRPLQSPPHHTTCHCSKNDPHNDHPSVQYNPKPNPPLNPSPGVSPSTQPPPDASGANPAPARAKEEDFKPGKARKMQSQDTRQDAPSDRMNTYSEIRKQLDKVQAMAGQGQRGAVVPRVPNKRGAPRAKEKSDQKGSAGTRGTPGRDSRNSTTSAASVVESSDTSLPAQPRAPTASTTPTPSAQLPPSSQRQNGSESAKQAELGGAPTTSASGLGAVSRETTRDKTLSNTPAKEGVTQEGVSKEGVTQGGRSIGLGSGLSFKSFARNKKKLARKQIVVLAREEDVAGSWSGAHVLDTLDWQGVLLGYFDCVGDLNVKQLLVGYEAVVKLRGARGTVQRVLTQYSQRLESNDPNVEWLRHGSDVDASSLGGSTGFTMPPLECLLHTWRVPANQLCILANTMIISRAATQKYLAQYLLDHAHRLPRLGVRALAACAAMKMSELRLYTLPRAARVIDTLKAVVNAQEVGPMHNVAAFHQEASGNYDVQVYHALAKLLEYAPVVYDPDLGRDLWETEIMDVKFGRENVRAVWVQSLRGWNRGEVPNLVHHLCDYADSALGFNPTESNVAAGDEHDEVQMEETSKQQPGQSRATAESGLAQPRAPNTTTSAPVDQCHDSTSDMQVRGIDGAWTDAGDVASTSYLVGYANGMGYKLTADVQKDEARACGVRMSVVLEVSSIQAHAEHVLRKLQRLCACGTITRRMNATLAKTTRAGARPQTTGTRSTLSTIRQFSWTVTNMQYICERVLPVFGACQQQDTDVNEFGIHTSMLALLLNSEQQSRMDKQILYTLSALEQYSQLGPEEAKQGEQWRRFVNKCAADVSER